MAVLLKKLEGKTEAGLITILCFIYGSMVKLTKHKLLIRYFYLSLHKQTGEFFSNDPCKVNI